MRNRIFWQFGIAIPLALAGVTATTSGNHVLAQLTPDNTLGAESSTVTVEQFRDLIRGGAIRDSALFHSFDEFNVGDGRSVLFDLQNNTDILNIFTRVTGGSSSQILGTLGVLNDLGNANLFLLNPNGITFGANASLQLNGSFFATTADGFGFDNFTFSASGQEVPPPLLTVSIPRFASFRDNPGDIVNQSLAQDSNGNLIGLQVPSGESLTLVGGDVNFQTGWIVAPGARVEIGGLSQAGTIEINEDLSLSFSDGVTRGNVSLTNVSNVNVSSNGGGSININARNLGISGVSQLAVGINSNSDSQNPQSGDINLNATESISLSGQDTTIFNQVAPGTTGTVGDVVISAPVFNMSDGASIASGLFGNGNAGLVNVQADTVSLTGQGTTIFSQIAAGGGAVEGILIDADTISLTEGARLVTTTFASGNASDININANNINFDGFSADGTSSGILATVQPDAEGNGGNVTITTDSLSLTNGASIDTTTSGAGNAGNTSINSSTITFDASNIFAQVAAGVQGVGGSIEITTNSLSLTNGASIDTTTFGAGNAGDTTIDASTITFNDSDIFAQVGAGAQGTGGNINITTDSLELTNGGGINTVTFGEGDAGDITVNATDIISIDGVGSNGFLSLISANVQEEAVGNAGNIDIITDSLSLTNGGAIASNITNTSQGNGGVITINANTITADGLGVNNLRSGIQATVNQGAQGTGGIINITTGFLSLTNQAGVNANTLGIGNAGNINIDADTISLASGGVIFGNTSLQGNGGVITINADTITLDNGNIEADVGTGAQGDGGSIEITTDSFEINNFAAVSATTSGIGNAGSITVNARTITFDDGDIFAQVAAGAQGTGGSIEITTDSLELNNGASINSITFGTGNAGDITITATETITLDGVDSNNQFASAIVANVQGEAVGNAGNIDVTANSLSLTNGGFIGSSTFFQGNAGNIKVIVTDTVNIEGIGSNDGTSAIVSDVIEGATGDAGTINIDSEAIIIQDGGEITVTNDGEGLGGNIFITSNTLTLDDGRIIANTTNDDNGNITLNISDYIFLLNGDGTLDNNGGSLALISANSQGDGGNLTIDTTALVAIPGQDSDITADSTGTEGASGGNVDINSEVVLGIQASAQDLPGRNDITADSRSGNAGTVTINTPQTNPQQEDIEPPENVTDETDVVAQNACSIGTGSQLANSGRGGLPQIPGFTIRNDAVDVDLVDEVLPAPPPEAIKPHHRTTVTFTDSEGEEFKPAMGAVLLPNGMVQFVDYNPAEVYRDMYVAAGCSR